MLKVIFQWEKNDPRYKFNDFWSQLSTLRKHPGSTYYSTLKYDRCVNFQPGPIFFVITIFVITARCLAGYHNFLGLIPNSTLQINSKHTLVPIVSCVKWNNAIGHLVQIQQVRFKLIAGIFQYWQILLTSEPCVPLRVYVPSSSGLKIVSIAFLIL